MTQEDKDLLLRDLCARLFYGVKVEIPTLKRGAIYELFEISRNSISVKKDNGSIITVLNTIDVLPYLRPMSSMTEEEIFEFIQIYDSVLRIGERKSTCILSLEQMDWLNEHHFDYRGLIERGLALEAPEGMY